METSANIKRLVKDIANIHKDPLTNEGVYYIHDDSNMLKGYAMIIGPSETPYHHGFFFFTFDFPKNYPHHPPKVTYMTNDGYTRFNPNFYRNGKVCLSILNTWKGEGWTSCQTLRTILLTLLTTLNEKPLLNEPGIRDTNTDVNRYNIIIRYKTLEFATLKMYKKTILEMFKPFIIKYIEQHIDMIVDEIQEYINNNEPKAKLYHSTTYDMKIIVNYATLIKEAKYVKESITLKKNEIEAKLIYD